MIFYCLGTLLSLRQGKWNTSGLPFVTFPPIHLAISEGQYAPNLESLLLRTSAPTWGFLCFMGESLGKLLTLCLTKPAGGLLVGRANTCQRGMVHPTGDYCCTTIPCRLQLAQKPSLMSWPACTGDFFGGWEKPREEVAYYSVVKDLFAWTVWWLEIPSDAGAEWSNFGKIGLAFNHQTTTTMQLSTT